MLLSGTAQSLLPDPGVGTSVTALLNGPPQSKEALLHELRHKLKLKEDDQSSYAKAEIFNALSSEITKYALKSADISAIKARLGARGDLPPDAYEIEIPPSVQANLVERCIRPNHIKDALRQPDAVQHLAHERFGYSVSLFLKHISYGEDALTLLVVAQRHGYKLYVGDALRIYRSEVETTLDEPLSVLRAFLKTYGLFTQIGNSLPAHLFLYEAVPFTGNLKSATDAIRVEGRPLSKFKMSVEVDKQRRTSVIPESEHIRGSGLARIDHRLSVVEVGIAYNFDGRRYNEDLRRHGVPVPR